ncbi:MAG TPA: hypothetical protein VFP61_06355 [Acidimicrobiales bacterium]|nr:hypothetical protein [Acidimicrobiales bacterium]
MGDDPGSGAPTGEPEGREPRRPGAGPAGTRPTCTAAAAQPGPTELALRLDEVDDRRLRVHAAAAGLPPDELARRWLTQRLEVEEAARRARGGGAEQLLRLVRAIEEVESPE